MRAMWGIICGLFVLAAWTGQAALAGAGIVLTAWHWAGLILWLIWSFFGVAVVWTFIAEREPRAAGVSAILFGVVSAAAAGILALIFKGLSA